MRSLRWRLIWIALATAFAVIALVPRNTTQRVLDQKTGRMKDTTVRRVPINLGLDLQGGIHLALEVDQSRGPVPDPAEAIRRAERVVRTRIDQFGTTEPVVQVVAGTRLIVELPGEKDPERAKRVIQQTAFLVPVEQVPVAESLLARPEVQRLMPRGIELKWGTQDISRGARSFQTLYAVEDRPIITGDELEKATARRDQLTNQSVVDFVLSRRGGRTFERETGRHVNDYMAIILDGRVQRQPPIIKSQIGQRGQIELGAKALQEAQDLALVLRAGALPAPLTIVEERTIGPSLGRDSIADGIRAGIVGVALVVLIMVIYYRLSGALAVAALTFYVLLTLGGLAAFGFTLTLPGLAGLVLSVGIAVGANVLIFERIREELQHGKLIRTAVDEGFKHAMSAIIDSNVSTALTAAILYLVGTGPVQGFAITLIIGIIASMFTAVFLVRTFYMIWLQRRPDMATLSV